ncbi:TrbC/VirB2 family protein [Luteimonas sp. SX5]|uniref:TrbC/VirB2 family protein n=1 Tax=Luteimonas galliterrae TaxID=2940486 RepID=A0ABT0MJQ3_9GAMM|nr:TrbC/VirB2 family protein [Luteimonas galliterrae]MCL1635114.1 TrbC/VirB2 family protein [Luteimonas galliterrae]
MKFLSHANHHAVSPSQLRTMASAFCLVAALAIPELAMAGAPPGGDAEGEVTRFFKSINGLLNIASIAVVTIAVVFAGYQIAFAHKRISDVAPILIGGFLVGAAAQIAKMLIGDNSLDTAMLTGVLNALYA